MVGGCASRRSDRATGRPLALLRRRLLDAFRARCGVGRFGVDVVGGAALRTKAEYCRMTPCPSTALDRLAARSSAILGMARDRRTMPGLSGARPLSRGFSLRWLRPRPGVYSRQTGDRGVPRLLDLAGTILKQTRTGLVTKPAMSQPPASPATAGSMTPATPHQPINLTRSWGYASQSLPAIHLVFGLAKRWLGIHHAAVSAKRLRANLDEHAFRFNRRTAKCSAHPFALLIKPRTRPSTYHHSVHASPA